MLEFPFLCSSPPAPCISAFKSQKTHVKKDGSVSINSKDTSKDSAALAGVALLSPSSRPSRTSSRRRPLPPEDRYLG